MTARRVPAYYILSALPAFALLALFFFVPLGFTFAAAFEDGARPLRDVLANGATYRVLAFTLREATLSALASTAAALPFAAFFSTYDFPGRKTLIVLSEIAFTIPTILVVLGFVIWYGNNGYLNALLRRATGGRASFRVLYSFKAIILAHVYLNFPIAFALITSAWSSLSPSQEYASRSLGRGALETFFRITLPRLGGTVAASFILIFLYCFSSFAIVMVLGGSPEYSTLEAEIYRRVHVSADMAGGGALALFTFAVTGALLLVTFPGRRGVRPERRERTLRRARGASLAAAALITLVMLLALLPPMLSIVWRSFFSRADGLSLSAWRAVLGGAFGAMETAPRAVLSSLAIALVSAAAATALATSIALAAAKTGSRLMTAFASLPLAAGSVTLGLGFLFVTVRLNLRSDALNYAAVAASHVVIALPMAVRTIAPGARMIPASLAAASYTLGASPAKTARAVERPLLAPYRRRAFAFSFALSLGEVNATLMLSSGGVTTLPVLIYRLIDTYNYQGAAALGTLLLAASFAVFTAGERMPAARAARQ